MRNILKTAILATVAAVTVSASAYAAPVERPQVAVSYDNSAAMTPTGRAALDRRIHRAAAAVCDTTGDHLTDTRCVAQAEMRAKGELDMRLAAIASPVQIAAN